MALDQIEKIIFMNKLLTLIFISISSICLSQQSRRDLLIKEIELAHPWPVAFRPRFYEFVITDVIKTTAVIGNTTFTESRLVATKENGKWIIYDGPAALEIMLNATKKYVKEIDDLKKENVQMQTAFWNLSPRSFSVNSTTKKSL